MTDEQRTNSPRLVTIGAYGFTAESFFDALREAGVDTFCDIRRRRGVRGADYSFANSQRLQARLETLGIRYLHQRDLAPTAVLRQHQYAADARAGVPKRQRDALDPAFKAAYEAEILGRFDAYEWLVSLPAEARVVALFCVERQPQACHRSLVAARLEAELGLPVRHLEPEEA